MNLIKTYLLPLILLLFFIVPSMAQSVSNDFEHDSLKVEISKVDSFIVNHYYTEEEYNRIYQVKQCETYRVSEDVYNDEIYGDQKHEKKRRRNSFNDIPVDLVVDIVVNTLFFVAILWQ